MRPYEVRHTNWQDPRRGLLKVGRVDVVIVDPPYTEHIHANLPNGKELGFAPLLAEERFEFASAMAQVVERWVFIFCAMEECGAWADDLERAGIEHVRSGFWEKLNACPQMTGDRPASPGETFVIGHARKSNGKPKRKEWNGGGRHAKYSTTRARGKGHPCEKPLPLMEAIVRDFTRPGELIADPYCGSGSTLVAAKRCGRRAIGWETQKRWADLARRRVSKARQQFDLFEGTAA